LYGMVIKFIDNLFQYNTDSERKDGHPIIPSGWPSLFPKSMSAGKSALRGDQNLPL
jgi:hypothetical protein